MKDIVTMMFAGAALVALPAAAKAQTTCPLEPAGSTTLSSVMPEGEQFAASAASAAIVGVLFDRMPAFNAAGCSREKVQQQILQDNNLQADQMLPRATSVRLVRVATAPAPKPVADAPATAVTAVPLEAVKPPVAPTPELRAAKVELAAAEKEKAVLTAKAQVIRARAANTALPMEARELTKKDRDLLNDLIVLKRDKIPALVSRVESLESRMTTVETDIGTLQGDVANVKAQVGQKANGADVYTKPEVDKMFANFVGGIDGWFWWFVVVGVPLALLLHLRSAFAAFGRGVKGVWQDLHIREMFRREKPSNVVPFRTSEIEPEEESGILELGDAQKSKTA